MIESVWQDLRYAARVLSRNRLFAAAAIGTLAIAIGANTAIFSLIDAAFLRPLPYPEPSRLIFLSEGQPSVTYSFSYPRYETLRERLRESPLMMTKVSPHPAPASRSASK